MPEFQIDHGTDRSAREFATLDAFTQGYIEAAFFATDESEFGDFTTESLSQEAWCALKRDAAEFQKMRADLLSEAYELPNGNMFYSEHQAGVDFWFTRNHHGVGFWDRGLGKVGDALTEAANSYGECDLYEGDDGQIYV